MLLVKAPDGILTTSFTFSDISYNSLRNLTDGIFAIRSLTTL